MDFNLIFAHLLLAVCLFFILNWIGNNSIHAGYIRMSVLAKDDEAPAFNFIYRAFSPVVYITIVSAISYKLHQEWLVKDIYLVVAYHFAFRLVFNIAMGRARLLNWLTQLSYILVSILFSYYVYDTLITHKEFLFPTSKELGSAMWLAIVAYIYHTFNSVKLSSEKTKARKANYLKNRYLTYNRLYGELIEGIIETKKQEALVYAVLIVEAFNRPKLFRLIENMLFFFGCAKTLGIMQVTTKIYINDRESVRLGSTKIVKDHIQAKINIASESYANEDWAIRCEVLKIYNPDDEYISEVSGLYHEIVCQYYPDEK